MMVPMYSHGKDTRWEWKVTYWTSGLIRAKRVEWRRTEASAQQFAEGKEVVSIEHAEHVLDY